MGKKKLICIVCPLGCSMEVELQYSKVTRISGNTCPRGAEYAAKECTNPARVITSSVYVRGGDLKILPVKSEKDIPKNKMFDVIRALKGIEVDAPISVGDVIVENISGTGVNIIAARKIESTVPTAEGSYK